MSARRQLIAYGAAIVLVVGACFGARFLTGRDHPKASASKIPSSTATTAQYSDLLAEADSAIGTDFRRLDTTNAQTLASAVPIAAQTMYAQAQRLGGVKAPPAAAAAHADLLTELTGFSDMIQRLGSDDAEQATPACPAAATSSYGSLLTSSFADHIRTDAKALVKANPAFVFGNFLPPAPALPSSRPATGALIKSPSKHGSGQLKIKNGGDDTAVSLVPSSGSTTPLLTVYVRGGANYTIGNVGTGTYKIFYAAGTDWNPERKGFMTDCTFSKFDDTFRFRAYPVIDTWEITMTPVAGGNASTSDVDPGTFPG
jgi:hypothetical protein